VRQLDYSDPDFDPDQALDDARRSQPIRRRPRTKGGRLTELERERLAEAREEAASAADQPTFGDRWSTWDNAAHGPEPWPDWVITDHAAQDVELGILKTGKEADVHLIRRALHEDGPATLLAAKRYRDGNHRMFHRDSQYLEGRRVRESRQNRAMANRSSFGRGLIAEQWAAAEFGALCRLWTAGVPVPYPVQWTGTELLMEFVGDEDGAAAPRLAQLRPNLDDLERLWREMLAALAALAGDGMAHGDLSAYNVLVHKGSLVLIDLPQVVDVVVNPAGIDFLVRDVRNIAGWFTARGLPADVVDPEAVIALLLSEAGLT
jgi:RIO kinase 1